MVAGYSGTPLPRKLGIASGNRVAILGAPQGFGLDVPPDVTMTTGLPAHADVVVFFTTERARLERRIHRLGQAIAPAGCVWIAWPKKAAKVPTDMTENVVREVVLPLGLVDTKVCAIDDTWSGLKVVWRKDRR